MSGNPSSRGPLTCFTLLLLGVVLLGYLGYLAGRPDLDVVRASNSLSESRADGLYVGAYTPGKPQVVLRDGSRYEVADAWIEHAWKPALAWLIFDRKRTADGFFVCLPLHPPTVTTDAGGPRLAFVLALAEADQRLTRFPSVGYVGSNGFRAYLDTLPEHLTFEVHQRRQRSESLSDTTLSDTVSFTRGH